mgnify:CR=1 FL=1
MIKIQIPATSANLGAGFDALGLALTYYNYIEMEECDKIDVTAADGLDIPFTFLPKTFLRYAEKSWRDLNSYRQAIFLWRGDLARPLPA